MTDTEFDRAYGLAREVCSPKALQDLRKDHSAMRMKLRAIQQKICADKCCPVKDDEDLFMFTSHHPDCDEIRDLFRPLQ